MSRGFSGSGDQAGGVVDTGWRPSVDVLLSEPLLSVVAGACVWDPPATTWAAAPPITWG